MTDWREFTAADFDARKAPKYVRQNAEQGQAPLFTTGTPTREAKRAAAPEQLPGQSDLFGEE